MSTTKTPAPKTRPAKGPGRRWLTWTVAAAGLAIALVTLYGIFSGATAPKDTNTAKNWLS